MDILFPLENIELEVQTAAERLQEEINSVRRLQSRLSELRRNVEQLAIASRLKAEMSGCITGRRPPVLCSLEVSRLNVEKLLLSVDLFNCCQVELFDWELLVQMSRAKLKTPGVRCSEGTTVCHSTCTTLKRAPPLVKVRKTLNIDVSAFCPLTTIRCFLLRSLADGSSPRDRRLICIRIHEEVVSLLHLVQTASRGVLVDDLLVSSEINGDVFPLSAANLLPVEPSSVHRNEETCDETSFHFSVDQMFCEALSVSTCTIEAKLLRTLLPQIDRCVVSLESSGQKYGPFYIDLNHTLYLVMRRNKWHQVVVEAVVSGRRSALIAMFLRQAMLVRLLAFSYHFEILQQEKQDTIAIEYCQAVSDCVTRYLPFLKFTFYITASTEDMVLESLRSKSAFVIGFTGETGKELVKLLCERKVFQRLVLIGRRQGEFSNSEDPKVEVKIINFDSLEDHKAAFADCAFGFCCLGTNRAKSGADGFFKVDHDYVFNIAKVAKESGGCKHFSVITTMGANKNSIFLYLKTKGLIEQHLITIGFDRLSVFRPAMLLCDREESRPLESVGKFILKPVLWAFPKRSSVSTSVLAKAMLMNIVHKPNDLAEFIENVQIHELGQEFDQRFS